VELTCATTPGVGGRLLWSVVVAGQALVNPRTRYESPSIDGVTVEDPATHVQSADAATLLSLLTSGGQRVIVTGRNLGSGATALPVTLEGVGDYSSLRLIANDCVMEVPHTRLRCITPPGVGRGILWRVRVAGQLSQAADSVTAYVPPTVIDITVDDRHVLPTSGGAVLIVTGANLGVDAAAIAVTWNGVPLSSPFLLQPQRRIGVAALPGEGSVVVISVSVAGQPVDLHPSLASWRFEDPVVLAVDIDVVAMEARPFDCTAVAADGRGTFAGVGDAVAIIIQGRSFGTGSSTSVLVGGVPCVGSQARRSHTYFECETQMCVGKSCLCCCMCRRLRV
jgi:hypothetical protein